MIDRNAIAHALERRNTSDWLVVDREQELAVLDEAAPRLRRLEQRTRWELLVHVDTPTGRGSARVVVDGRDGQADALVDQALALARATVGPAWSPSPLAAPARAPLIDDELAKLALLDAADRVRQGVRPASSTVTATASCLREHVTAMSRAGLRTSWTAALVHVDAVVAVGEHSLAITREARRRSDLSLDTAFAEATRDAALLAEAGAPTPGTCALVLGGDAMLDGGGLGLWETFAHQANAVVERQGLTRYREGKAIARGADEIRDALAIASDGALPYGVRSSPIGDDGDAVRRFSIIERGVAVGLGLGAREAALRGRDPNGGVRNLVVTLGSWTGELPADTRVVEVLRLRQLAIDPYTGDARLELGLAIDHTGGAAKPFTGGTVRLDVISALAFARRSNQRLRRGPYDGPHAILIERAEVIV